MRLKQIKLAGFKSFVDPLAIPIGGNLIGIVGPNGCGKSNIIDAVRWVMGESSATRLRGDSMADVIFNGSSARKPIGKASVELVFDNSDGRAGGEYAGYSEIAIRREAGRDGLSDYYLNKTKCRRKDITDLFLGTGLGPRAYSIIEQGMVTRIIEAKPEDLRGFVEEAAGISKYRERRRETENRIRHTRENMARVEDIRKELGAQLGKLQRQSKAAARYKELKQEERLTRAQLLALRWRALDAQLQQHDADLRQRQTALEAVHAEQRRIEAEMEAVRGRRVEADERDNAVQAEFYAVGGEISRLEQAIEHARETRAAQQREQDQINRSWEEGGRHLESDRARLAELERRLEENAPRLAQLTQARAAAATAVRAAEDALGAWQDDWHAFSESAAEPAKTREIQDARIHQLAQHVEQLRQRQTRLQEELGTIAAEHGREPLEAPRAQARALDQECEARERSLGEVEAHIRDARRRRDELDGELARARGELQSCAARLASLRELHDAAGGRDEALRAWLRAHDLEQARHLTGMLQVEPGWEPAVERVLGMNLAALCVPGMDRVARDAAALTQSSVAFFDPDMPPAARRSAARPALLDKLQSQADLAPLLDGVYTADSLDEALAARAGLAARESIISRDGAWVGRNWLSLGHEKPERAGWLLREREIEALQTQAAEQQKTVADAQARLADAAAQLQALEDERDALGRSLNELNRERALKREQLGHLEARRTQIEARMAQIRREQEEDEALLARDQAEIERATELLRRAETSGDTHGQQRARMQQRRADLQLALEQARAVESGGRDDLHRLEIERQGLQTELDSIRAAGARLEGQLRHLGERREELARLLAADARPEAELQQRLNEFLQQRLAVEERLGQARAAVADLDTALRAREQERAQQEKQAQQLRDELETKRVARQELLVRRDTLAEQVRESGFELEPVLQETPPAAGEQEWLARLDSLAERIERLGPINLVAIEESRELSERKGYLDKQSEDLSQALAMLEEAIRKMDRETRARFKETFDRVNEGFQSFFPRLFGGGTAYLELTDNDLLETGVTVMARPPGKRNSTIHLLSGGEKALTAVALLFAIFELNPAPFCLLDEVDAPLDDANVERYCETIKAMSGRTQLVYVTHNKISMEMADILIGVTMSEPGVSRLVAVDVEAALEMVAR
ncbi:MAG: chromosome segregation protein SMC [Candidatus Muproteobacteria bacterium RIFCSPHIGHO2_01_FULL_65_16]|uniref:Chromosome partition protein Smc n=1 Tax=Candidatus Muproteobacteria bacterium RIFCSPHIGHO2_01_FULL_65_16 TaxID=1817764 RepID=A0A1F6TQ92_9PROT|nr:MAG: chromosome segregation protein SMC [Candidatus Muproteobacteria bacterium RIFCSPHIGHO2_01_FULL_65_16]